MEMTMTVHVRIFRLGAGAVTRLTKEYGRASKEYSSWQEALRDAQRRGFLTEGLAKAAMETAIEHPIETTIDVDPAIFSAAGFIAEKLDG